VETVTERAAPVLGTDAVIDLTGEQPVVELAGEPTVAVVTHEQATMRWSLLMGLAILNILDLVTTRAVLQAGGTEANPIMAQIVHDPIVPVLVKTAALAVVALVLRACPPVSRLVDRALFTVTAVYGVIVAWNLANLLQS
jgi:hypothetical protein